MKPGGAFIKTKGKLVLIVSHSDVQFINDSCLPVIGGLLR